MPSSPETLTDVQLPITELPITVQQSKEIRVDHLQHQYNSSDSVSVPSKAIKSLTLKVSSSSPQPRRWTYPTVFTELLQRAKRSHIWHQVGGVLTGKVLPQIVCVDRPMARYRPCPNHSPNCSVSLVWLRLAREGPFPFQQLGTSIPGNDLVVALSV